MRTSFRSLFLLLLAPAVLQAGSVVFTEVMYHPLGAKPEFIEITNLTSNRIDIAKWKLTGGVDFTFPDFTTATTSAHLLKEYERVVVSSADEATTRAAWPALPPTVRVFGPWSGALNNAGDGFSLKDAASAVQSTVNYKDSGDWPMAADGGGHSLQIINQNGNVDDWRNWRASRFAGGSPGVAEPVLLENPLANAERTDRVVVDYSNAWKYWRTGTDPDGLDPEGTWFSVAYPETDWQGPSPGFFGHDPNNATLQAARGTSFTTGYSNTTITYYFRTTFNWTGALTGQTFGVDQFVDDGVVYYLNGRELKGDNLGRVRMAAGATTHTTLATGTPAGGDAAEELNILSGSLDGQLVSGTNVLCAEVHQNSTVGDDIYFGARFRIATPAPAGVVINEVRPAGVAGAGFVEFYNPTADPVNLNGYYLSDIESNLRKVTVALPAPIPAGGYAIVDFAGSGLSAASPVTVLLTQPDGFTRQSGFRSAMVVDGRSAGRQPSGGSTWVLFTQPTPGAANVSVPAPTVVLSEIAFGDKAPVDWVEVYNSGTGAQSLAGLYLSSRSDLADRVPLSGSLPAGGYASQAVTFTPSAGGRLDLFLSDSSNNILNTAKVTRARGMSSHQTWPAGSGTWYATPDPTRDAVNNPERHDEIVINEIMFKLPSGHDDGEYIELYNKGAGPVSLGGWQFTDGISYTIPQGTLLAAGSYLVVAHNPAYMAQNYSGLGQVVGPFSGTLRSSGEKIRLQDERGNQADLVDYKQGGQWPTGTGGEGSSLELLNPGMDNNLPSSWRASNETAKASFRSYSYTGTYKELRGTSPDLATTRELLLNLAGDGYMILKNLKLTKASAPTVNQIKTGDATSHNGSSGGASTGFLCTGTHCDSDTVPRAANPVRYDATLSTDPGFHLISQGSGDTKANLAQVDVTGIVANDVLTLSFDARWVYGIPVMIAQTWDRSFGKVFHFPVPGNLGTPGAVNSRATASPAPSVDNMAHFPVVPTSIQPVVVTARVDSTAALAAVSLFQRPDTLAGNGAWITQPMNDNGTEGDAVAGDRVWSATVPARANTSITQFYIKATAVNGQENECPRQGARRPGLWIVANTPPATAPGLLTERTILSLRDRNLLNPGTGFSATNDYDHPRMSNYGWNSTFIFNETEVLYNCEIRRGGSPWTRIGSNLLDRVRWKPPGDRLFRERSKLGIDNDATNTNTGTSRFHNRIVRYLMYLLGYPVPDSEFVQQIVNADAARLGDEQEQTDSDFFDRAYPDGASGELFEIDDSWFMYDSNMFDDRLDAGSVTGRWALTDWSSGAAPFPSDESPIYYHGNWPLRFPEDRYDYSALSSLFKTVVNGNAAVAAAQDASYRERMERLLNIDRTAIYAAVRGYAGDWDNFTLNRGKNGYFYRPPNEGRFEFHHWDSDLAFQNTGEVFLGTTAGIGWTNLTGRPWFRQRFNFYLASLVDRFTNATSPRMNAWLAAMNYQSANTNALAAFKTNAFNYTSGWFTQRNPGAIAFIGSASYNRAFSVSTATGQTVTNPLFSLAGAASSKVNYVEIAGHPEAVFTWVPTAANPGLWTMSNVALAAGLNTLTLRTILHDGSIAGNIVITVTLTGNAPPIPGLTSNPASGNVAIGETLQLDATGSRDPEGLALSYNWTVLPAAGVTLTPGGPALASAHFSIPGSYAITLSVTDAAAQTVALTKEFTVFSSTDFSSFGGSLGPEFTLTNLEHRDNFSPSSWYSVEDISGRILIQITNEAAQPMAAPTFTHPLVSRALPASGNFVLQTDFRPDTREFGNWRAGLMVQLNEGGATVRYAIGVEGGINLLVLRSALPNAWSVLSTTPVLGSGAALRVNRSGDSLLFQMRTAGGWTTAWTQAVPAGTLAENGGIFTATSQATAVRIGFDYLLLSDPSASNSVLTNLRITEINYRPAAGGVEFIELCNTGARTIDLTGVRFGQGQPFSMAGNPLASYTFGSEILAPGEYLTITDNVAAFRALYGNGPRLAPAWNNGSLSNNGERIVLIDAAGNTIQDFTYGVAAPWPVAANGAGASLEIISTFGDYNQGTNWKASLLAGGSPGGASSDTDSDGDGVPDVVEALFGTHPFSAGSVPAAVLTAGPGGSMTLTWPSIPGVIYRVESSPALAAWQVIQTVTGAGSWTFIPAPGEPRRYYRVSASAP